MSGGNGLRCEATQIVAASATSQQSPGGSSADDTYWVRRSEGVTISDDVAAELIAFLTLFAEKVADRSWKLSARAVAIGRDIGRALPNGTRAFTHDDASAEVIRALDLLALEPSGLVSAAAAGRRIGITADGVRDLCRRGRLDATQVEGRWWIVEASVDDYATRRRTGEGAR